MAKARVMVVEDEAIVAEDLRRTLAASGYEVVGHAMDGPEAIRMARRFRPDVVLMDICLGGSEDGIRAAQAIQESVDTAVLYVTAHCSDSLVSDAVRSGAFGYVIKPFQAQQITSSIEVAFHRRQEARRLAERTYREPRQVRGSINERRRNEHLMTFQRLQSLVLDDDLWAMLARGEAGAAMHLSLITPREIDVIRSLVCYRRPAKVAKALGISVNTARKHLKSVFRKLNVHSQDELLRLLLETVGQSPTARPSAH